MLSLTSRLLDLDVTALREATTHPFLAAAATSSLDNTSLKFWLAQDRLYALTYTSFIGSLLSHTAIPTSADRATTLGWRCADMLIDCLTNIRRELALFEDTATDEGWLEEICDGVVPTVQTRAYQDLFAGATAQARPLSVGLTILWATEECYLRAWKYALSKMNPSTEVEERSVMQRVFIPNWSSPEFEAFVGRIRGLLDEHGDVMEQDGWEAKECETAYRQVLWAEKNFWPSSPDYMSK